MATKTIAWNSGTGNITVTYGGSGDGTAVITSSDNNLYEARSQQVTLQTTAGSPQRTVTVTVAQAAKQRIDLSTAVVTAANQTYSGSALTPTPTVTLNGDTVPSTGYDVAYSNNTNAGTATITITGKGDYTGTATGTFAIAKANPTYTAPTAQSLTYNRSSQYLTTTGSTSDGTIQYSSNGSSWGTTRKTGTNAGSYTTYWRLVGDSNHNDVASTSISVTISKATPVVNVAPSKATSLTYTGSAQNLLTGGSMKHSSTDSTAVAGTFTYAQGTNAGTYNSLTWSFAPTDSTNYNSASGTVSGSVSIAKASRTLSFTDSIVVLPPSSNVTKTATPSAGSGDGAITYSIASTTYATINSSTGKVTSKSSEGKTTVTATIAAGTNYLSASASYTLYVFATTHNYSTASSYSSLTLPAGTYKLQCWGAQGGSNAADSTYGITAKAGGKGGYSEGQLTVVNETTVRAYVGGQGSSSAGGYNGGGSTSGTSTYNSGGVLGISKMGGGGGASDIRLSDGSLYSRMIVAGGGSGGAMCCKRLPATEQDTTSLASITASSSTGSGWAIINNGSVSEKSGTIKSVSFKASGATSFYVAVFEKTGTSGTGQPIYKLLRRASVTGSSSGVNTVSINLAVSQGDYIGVQGNGSGVMPVYGATVTDGWHWNTSGSSMAINDSKNFSVLANYTIAVGFVIESAVSDTTVYQVGYVGGGTSGGGFSDSYKGRQNAAGSGGGDFGQGANQVASSYRYVSGAGGGGWYGGGRLWGNDDINTVKVSGGGSGWVNTSASSGNRPSVYSSLQLDSGTTYDGTQTFVAPGGGNETGHAGNGYVRITRL